MDAKPSATTEVFFRRFTARLQSSNGGPLPEENVTYRHLEFRDPAGFSEADDRWARHGPAPKTSLLPTARDDRFDPDPGASPDESGTETFGSVNLVARQAHQVNVHLLDVDRDLADRLGGVGVEESSTVAPDDLANFLERLNYPNLVVDCHDGNEDGVGADGGFKLRKVNKTIACGRTS